MRAVQARMRERAARPVTTGDARTGTAARAPSRSHPSRMPELPEVEAAVRALRAAAG
jgi:hypothetical protein